MTEELPPGWAISRLQSLVGRDGLMCDGDWVESKDQDPKGAVRLIQLADIGDGKFLDKSHRFLTQQKAEQLNCTFLAPRDLLIARLGEPLGKTCIFPPLDQPCVTVVDVHVLRPASEEISREWLMHNINSAPVRRVLDSMSSGTTRKRVTGQKLKDLEVRVPPAPEQARIASKIDELFSRIEEGERALERVQKLVERYRQSVLKAAVTGELTRDRREKNKGHLESGEALLARILKARRDAWEKAELDKMKAKGVTPPNDNWKQKYKEPAAPDATDLPDLPDGWVWASLNQIAAPEPNAITDGPFGSNLKTEHYTDTGPRVVRLQNIKDGVFADERAHISPERFAQLQKHRVFPGDLLIAALGESLPRVCIAPADLGPAIVKADCIRLKPNPLMSSDCVAAFLNSPPARQRTKATVHGVGRPRLNLDEIRSLAVPIPPAEEQRAIADAIASQTSSLEHLQLDAELGLTQLKGLRQSILARAFRGELVSQSATDEPALALLDRIAAERGNAPAESKRSRRIKTQETP